MNSLDALNKKIDNAPKLDFGDIISDAIELFKVVWLKGFLVVLIIAGMAFGLSLVFQAIGLAPDPYVFMNGIDIESFASYYSQNAIYSIPQNIALSSITIALLAAFYRICKQTVQGEKSDDDYFYYFKNGYFSKALMLGIIYTAISTVAQMLLLLPYIYVMVPLSFFAIFFSNHPDLKEMEIVKLSFALGNKKWFIAFGTILVCFILGFLGIIGCFIGILFTISIAYLPVFLIYKQVIGFDNTSEIDLIGLE
ncbi:hypothetical protein [Seonamhaeicola marinus]|uniref:Beta-carotene 15,15'-monooxygenase n=1 Tax=Seonamhaeicola marinus TaxID=1912246 RepID=A0A5D0HVD8_9FLAO|nr:hypothetical protein [Seonamhaeicola marinus]TYA74891.1 hypothetical protein FUA24_16440 [Seonamhaeicola marinus]